MIESFINNQSKALMKKNIYIAAFFQIELSILHKKTKFLQNFCKKICQNKFIVKKVSKHFLLCRSVFNDLKEFLTVEAKHIFLQLNCSTYVFFHSP